MSFGIWWLPRDRHSLQETHPARFCFYPVSYTHLDVYKRQRNALLMKKAPLLLLLILPFCLLSQQYPINSININLPQNADPYTTNWTSGNSLLSINVSSRALGGKLDPI